MPDDGCSIAAGDSILLSPLPVNHSQWAPASKLHMGLCSEEETIRMRSPPPYRHRLLQSVLGAGTKINLIVECPSRGEGKGAMHGCTTISSFISKGTVWPCVLE
ncbi:hypothetical protein KC19_4G055100 [Ceratodon purpureus]|uniref:Uncharacterized protein n=1 Tax=Ceratodon purpureus TaxID=3225 RepID=A0A8T0I848_CERPU|nr:hypothetical protein KC19_4G055100 [Ceratodon purpureus]